MRGKYPEIVPRAEEEDNNKDSSPNLSSNSQWDDISSVILGLPFSTCPHPPLVCVLQLQPVQSCFYSPTGLFRLMRYKQTCLRWLKKLTRGQQILKIKTFCTGLIRILLLLWDQLCRNSKSLPIPDTLWFCNFLISSSQTTVSISTMLFTRAVFKGLFHTPNLQQNIL